MTSAIGVVTLARSTSAARYIKHTSIRLGDLIRVSYKVDDMTLTREGVVRKRLELAGTTEYQTGKGVVLFTVYRDGTTDIGVKHITWIKSDIPQNNQPETAAPLFEME